MTRQLALGTGALSITQQTTTSLQLSRLLSSHTNTHNRNGSDNVSSIAEWLASFNDNVETIPSSIVKTKMALSPNRNSRSFPKIICRASIDALTNHVPQKVLERVPDSIYYIRGSNAVETTSEKKTSASANRDDCIKKIRSIIRETAEKAISEAKKRPPRQLPKSPPNPMSRSEAKKRFGAHKRLQRTAKVDELVARAREERLKNRAPRK